MTRRAIQTTMDLGLLVQRGVMLLKKHAPADGSPYYGAFSGGKDSCAIKELARMAGVPVEWHYHMTTIDPPELVRFIRAEHPDVVWDKPKHGNLFRRAIEKGEFPTRTCRWCCREYKERLAPKGSHEILGVRVAESKGRRDRWTACTMPGRAGRLTVLPIRLWVDSHVWDFIRWRGIAYCSLYDEGFERLGCVGCPLITPGQRAAQFCRWPGFERRWRLLFDRLWSAKAGTTQRDKREWFGSRNFGSAESMFAWWNAGQPNITRWKNADAGLSGDGLRELARRIGK